VPVQHELLAEGLREQMAGLGIFLQAQSIIADLADLGNPGVVRVVASIDHVNAPLLWDKKLLARFNWYVS